MVYLKTIFTKKSELDFIRMQILELNHLINKIILIEPSFNHNGTSRELIGFSDLFDLDQETLNKIIYVVVPKFDFIKFSKESKKHHYYETVTRGFFVKQLNLKNSDIIISTDADEILYENIIREYIKKLKKSYFPVKRYVFDLYQFFYKYTLYSKTHSFIAPGIYHYGSRFLELNFYLIGYINWRYKGKIVHGKSGVHFSWIQPINDLVYKALNWSHSSEFSLNEVEIKDKIVNDIDNKQYSFRSEPIKLEELGNNKQIWPKSFKENFDGFF
jgi:hypothetical protein